MLAFTDKLNLKRYALYVFDYGAPTGFRLAMAHPERVTAIVSQNGNAYEEGLGDAGPPSGVIGSRRQPRIGRRYDRPSARKASDGNMWWERPTRTPSPRRAIPWMPR